MRLYPCFEEFVKIHLDPPLCLLLLLHHLLCDHLLLLLLCFSLLFPSRRV